MMADITRLAQEEGVSLSQWFATAAAYRAGYEIRRRDDAVEVDRLSKWSVLVDRHLERLDARVYPARRR